jgi:hypothetical protein
MYKEPWGILLQRNEKIRHKILKKARRSMKEKREGERN